MPPNLFPQFPADPFDIRDVVLKGGTREFQVDFSHQRFEGIERGFRHSLRRDSPLDVGRCLACHDLLPFEPGLRWNLDFQIFDDPALAGQDKAFFHFLFGEEGREAGVRLHGSLQNPDFALSADPFSSAEVIDMNLCSLCGLGNG